MAAPKLGVWLCDCEGTLAGRLDFARLEEEARQLEGVSWVSLARRLCGREAQEMLVGELGESGVDRLLFVGCSERSSLQFPEEQIKRSMLAAGLDQALLESANVREQCAWLHQDPKEATEKALALLRMAHARLLMDQPRGKALPLSRRALVVGGGAAGLQVAQELAALGQEVTLVERKAHLGGHLCQVRFLLQTESWPSHCLNECIGPEQARQTILDPRITLRLQSRLSRVEKKEGNFAVTIESAPQFVHPERCISCGECAAVCPEETPNPFDEGLGRRKAIDKDFERALPDTYNIIEEACTRCGDCLPLCPTAAIDLEAQPTRHEEEAGALFLATGFDSYDLHQNKEFRYDLPDVISWIEFERLLERGLKRPSDSAFPARVTFVMCAGSRVDGEKSGEGVSYCSKTCCGLTIKQVERLAMIRPDTEINIVYYRDIRAYERAFEQFYVQTRAQGVEFINGEINEIRGENNHLALSIAPLEEPDEFGPEPDEEGNLLIESDLVVLSAAQVPSREANPLHELLGLTVDRHGFPIENQPRILRPTESLVDRVYVVGASAGPKVVQQSVEQGSAAAMKALPTLLSGQKEPLKYASVIDTDRCARCGICAAVCPHGAIELTDQGARVEAAFCQACGLCAAACPTHAAQLINFSDEQLLQQVDVAFTTVPPGQPRLLALLCYWCGYSGADLAGVKGLEAPSNHRSIRVRCASSVNNGLLLEMFRRGVDGILLAGCPPKNCHHLRGNYLADKRILLLSKFLQQMGLHDGRLRFEYYGVKHSQEIVRALQKMDQQLRQIGPNPLSSPQEERREYA